MRLAVLVLLLAWSACAKAPATQALVAPPGPTPTARLAEADRLVRAGCLDCLLDAYRGYQSLRASPSAASAATMGAIRAAGLIALRQRELGMVDEGYVAAARELVAAAEQEAVADIAAIRASADPPERQARQIARREKRIAEGRRMVATSWYNTAVAYFSLSNKDEARQFAEKVSADEQFGERDREILARLGKQP